MFWIFIILIGHLSNAGAFIIDKILLHKTMRHPAVYVFYIGLLSLLAFILLPFGHFFVPAQHIVVRSAISGATFMAALFCFFTSLKKGEATRVVPFFGALIPIWTIFLASIFLGEYLRGNEWLGIAFLILGAVLISYEQSAEKSAITVELILLIILASGLFALSSTMLKSVFNATEFINGFLWTRVFGFLTVVPLILLPSVRQSILPSTSGTSHQPKERPNLLFFIGQSMGALGFIFLAWGTDLAPRVTIVNALQGVQYAFLFILVVIISKFAPRALKESLSRSIIIQKTIAIILLTIGLALVT